jgi:hypothetical protein
MMERIREIAERKSSLLHDAYRDLPDQFSTFLLTFTMAVATAPGSNNLGLDLCDLLLKPTYILHQLVAAKKGRTSVEWSVLAQRVMSNSSLFDETEPAHSRFTRAARVYDGFRTGDWTLHRDATYTAPLVFPVLPTYLEAHSSGTITLPNFKVYMLVHESTLKCYIGQTLQEPRVRFLEHHGYKATQQVQTHIHTHGSSFRMYILGQAPNREAANNAESYFMHLFDTTRAGLNLECKEYPVILSDFNIAVYEVPLDDVRRHMTSFRKRRGQESAHDYGAAMVQHFVQKKNLPYFTLHAGTRVKSSQAWAHGLVAQVPDFSNGAPLAHADVRLPDDLKTLLRSLGRVDCQ